MENYGVLKTDIKKKYEKINLREFNSSTELERRNKK